MPFSSHFDTAPAYWTAGALWTVLADGTSTGGSYSLFEELCPSGLSAPPHMHAYADEVFYVLDGEAEFIAGEVRQTAGKGSLMYIPRGTVHAFKIRSASARFLNLYAQPGMERLLMLEGQQSEKRTPPPPGWRQPATSPSRQREVFSEIGMHPVAVAGPAQ